jgi:hypothetical protein
MNRDKSTMLSFFFLLASSTVIFTTRLSLEKFLNNKVWIIFIFYILYFDYGSAAGGKKVGNRIRIRELTFEIITAFLFVLPFLM